jgi:uncharacterized paraquat-inducible protein A
VSVAAPPEPDTIACPRCGTTVGPEQQWCLHCGAPARTRLVPTPNWRAPLLVLALIAVLAAVALAIAFVEITKDDTPATPTTSQPAPTQPAQP